MEAVAGPSESRSRTAPGGLLTSGELAAYLRVHPKHVYRLLRAGLPGLRVGGEWRFDAERVRAWAEQRGRRHGEPAPAEDPFVAANDDEAVGLLLDALAGEAGPLLGTVRADSGGALDLVASGRALVAGFHRREVPGWAGERRLARVRFVEREIGLVGRRGRAAPPLRACAEARVASRPASSGTRSLFDAALAAAKLSSEAVHERAATLASHRDVVCAVARGDADVGVASRDWAERVGLSFRAIGVESYDLLVPADRLGHPAVVTLCEMATRPAVRRAVGSLPGHSARAAGTVELPSAADRPQAPPGMPRGPRPRA
jgi:excisionase family DNA binding protein